MNGAAQKVNLYRLDVPVRPRVDHATYFDWGYGILTVWITDTTPESAVERVASILALLPYELAGEVDGHVGHVKDPKAIKTPVAINAWRIGLALELNAVVTGADEGETWKQFCAGNYLEELEGEEWKNPPAGDDNPQAT